MCAFINFKKLTWTSAGIYVHNLTAMIFLSLLLLIPIALIFHLSLNFELLNDKKNAKPFAKFNDFFDGLKLENGKIVFYERLFFILRRVWLAAAVVFFSKFIE